MSYTFGKDDLIGLPIHDFRIVFAELCAAVNERLLGAGMSAIVWGGYICRDFEDYREWEFVWNPDPNLDYARPESEWDLFYEFPTRGLIGMPITGEWGHCSDELYQYGRKLARRVYDALNSGGSYSYFERPSGSHESIWPKPILTPQTWTDAILYLGMMRVSKTGFWTYMMDFLEEMQYVKRTYILYKRQREPMFYSDWRSLPRVWESRTLVRWALGWEEAVRSLEYDQYTDFVWPAIRSLWQRGLGFCSKAEDEKSRPTYLYYYTGQFITEGTISCDWWRPQEPWSRIEDVVFLREFGYTGVGKNFFEVRGDATKGRLETPQGIREPTYWPDTIPEGVHFRQCINPNRIPRIVVDYSGFGISNYQFTLTVAGQIYNFSCDVGHPEEYWGGQFIFTLGMLTERRKFEMSLRDYMPWSEGDPPGFGYMPYSVSSTVSAGDKAWEVMKRLLKPPPQGWGGHRGLPAWFSGEWPPHARIYFDYHHKDTGLFKIFLDIYSLLSPWLWDKGTSLHCHYDLRPAMRYTT